MSHFTVGVVTETSPTTPEGAAELIRVLQPFHEYESTGIDDEYVVDVDVTEEWRENKTHYDTMEAFADDYGYTVVAERVIRKTNPNCKWDWWVVGGRWSDYWLLRDGSRADSAIKSEIDTEMMEQKAAENALEEYESVMGIVGDGNAWVAWEQARETHDDIDDARRFYRTQPAIKQLSETERFRGMALDKFLVSKEEYVASARSKAICQFALLKDGKWHEEGRMGWFACVTDKKDNWTEEYHRLWNTISGDKYITVVDCHI